MSSTSPPVTGERKLFSDVTRLGFAAAHDSPSLKADESIDALSTLEMTGESSRLTGKTQHYHYIFFLFLFCSKTTITFLICWISPCLILLTLYL